MKRLHIHVNVAADRMATSTDFYTTLFGTPPTKTRDGYAKWLIEDPRVNFVIEAAPDDDHPDGIHHLGLQVDAPEELERLRKTLRDSEAPLLDIGETVCCFSRSNKAWTQDPVGVRWEAFRSFGDITEYGSKTEMEQRLYNG